MGRFPSGQRGQTVNLLATPSVVRIHHRPLKRYASWVQNVVREFGPYPAGAEEICEELSLVREDRDGRTSGVSVVDQRHGRVAKFGRDKR